MKNVLKYVKQSLALLLLIAIVLMLFNSNLCVAKSEEYITSTMIKAVEELGVNKNEKLFLNEHGAEIKDNEVLLFLKKLDDEVIEDNLSELNLELLEVTYRDGIVVARKDNATSWQWINDRAAQINNVVAMMPNYKRVKLSDVKKNSGVVNVMNADSTLAINDPLFSSQWYLSKENGINIQEAWKTTMGSPTVKVAVIDSGAAIECKEFEGRIIKQYDNTNGDNDASDDSVFSHGSHVSGIIAANINNNYGISGIAPYVSLIEIDCFEYVESEDDEVASDASIFKAFDICIEQGVRIANMSFGAFANELGPIEKVIYITKLQDLRNAGVVPVSAAGNESSTDQCIPADLPAVVGVVALDEKMNLASYSNYGMAKDICAPGNGIVSVANTKHFQKSDGTSMAAPMFSGVLALLASRAPYVSNDELLEIIYTTATDLGAKGKDSMFANGKLNAGAAMEELNRRYPVELSSFNEDNLVLKDGNKKSFTIKLYDTTTLSISVTNVLTGEMIKNIYDVDAYEAGEYALSWDGKDNNGNDVSNGKYCISINVFSNDVATTEKDKNDHTISFSFFVTDKDYSTELPVVNIKIKNNVCQLSGFDNLEFAVNPSDDMLCDIVVVDSNDDIIATLDKDIIISSQESKSFTWDLYNKDNELLRQGLYNIAVIVKNEYAHKTYKMNFSTVNVPKPKVKKVKVTRYKGKTNKNVKVNFKLNTTSHIYIRVFNIKKRRVLEKDCKIFSVSKCVSKVRLRKNNKWLKSGTYYIRIVAHNSKGTSYSKFIRFKITKNKKASK